VAEPVAKHVLTVSVTGRHEGLCDQVRSITAQQEAQERYRQENLARVAEARAAWFKRQDHLRRSRDGIRVRRNAGTGRRRRSQATRRRPSAKARGSGGNSDGPSDSSELALARRAAA
jgi:hypothetical protein